MKTYQNAPAGIEVAYAPVGPTFRGDLATSHVAYPAACFGEPVTETSTSASAVLVDMAKWADGTTRASWLRGGVLVKIKVSAPCHIAQLLTNSTSGGQHVTTSKGEPLDAGEEITKLFDEDFRYLEYIWDGTAGTITHYPAQRANYPIALADT